MSQSKLANRCAFPLLADDHSNAAPLRPRTGGSPLRRTLLRIALFVLTGLASVTAHANLTCEVGNVSKVVDVGTISVPVNATPGTTVRTLAPQPFQLLCNFPNSGQPDTSGTLYSDFKTSATLAAGYTDVYQTGIAGLGMRYTFNSPGCNAANVVMANGSVRLSCPFSGTLGAPATAADVTVSVTLIVTSKLVSGASTLSTVPVVTIGFATSDGGSGYWNKSNLYTGSATGALIQATCSVTQPKVDVTLPTVSTGALSSSVGATAGSQAFSLTFNCVAGAKVLITLTDNVNPANQSKTLQLTPDSTAQGVGVQILNSGLPVAYGPDSAAIGNANQWLIGASPNGPLQVPLTARYISTGTVLPGMVKALATFTMSYQ